MVYFVACKSLHLFPVVFIFFPDKGEIYCLSAGKTSLSSTYKEINTYFSDNFFSFAGGLSVRQPITQNLAIFGAVSGNNKINGSETEFDTSALDFNAGLDYHLNQHTFTLAAQDNHFDLGGESFRRAYGGTAQWLYNVDAFNQIGAYGQYTGLSYNGTFGN